MLRSFGAGGTFASRDAKPNGLDYMLWEFEKGLAQMTHSDTRIEQRLSPLDYFFLVFALGFFSFASSKSTWGYFSSHRVDVRFFARLKCFFF
jgi:hypothetical protein